MMPLGAPSITKYGSLVRPDAQIVALRAHCASGSPLVPHPDTYKTPTHCVTQPTPQLHTCSAILTATPAIPKADARKGHVLQTGCILG